LRQRRKAAMMQPRQQPQVVLAQPLFAAIAGMAVQGELSLGEPAPQGFGIDAQVPTTVGDREKGHGATPFVWCF